MQNKLTAFHNYFLPQISLTVDLYLIADIFNHQEEISYSHSFISQMYLSLCWAHANNINNNCIALYKIFGLKYFRFTSSFTIL